MVEDKTSKYQDIIDSRDIIERIDELEADEDRDEDESEELRMLKELQSECEGYAADWHHGEALIRYSYFTEYAQELAEDCGMLTNCTDWPARCIDWEQAANELKVDYTEVDYDGVSYFIR
ncbi:MAG: hypothetical protein OES25_16870 [Acidobacteriota bacterium]|nr:hypothetical protein [Acidobacteriota bacterium]